MDLLAHPAQALHALDCIGHLVWLDVLGFVHVKSFCVNFVDEGQGDSKLFSSRWVQCEGRQVCQGAIADERVVANRGSRISSWIRHVLNADGDDFVTVSLMGFLSDFRLLATSTAAKTPFGPGEPS